MEKQITIEKQKKLKNETMFNFKNVSLMKKQLFSLMMAFALVVGLSVSALAQGSTVDPGDSWTDFNGFYYNDPSFMIQNSVRGFSVDAHGDNTFAWTVYTVDITTGTATAAEATEYALWASADGTGALGTDANTAYVEWLLPSEANEVYAVEVTETNDAATSGGSCTTVRRFYVLVYGVDMTIIASNSNGVELTAAGDLVMCNLWSGDVIGNHLTDTQLGEQDGSHQNDNGTDVQYKYDTLYVNVSMAGSLGDWVAASTLTEAERGRILAGSNVNNFRWMFAYNITTDAVGTTFNPTTDGSILSVTETNDVTIYFDTEGTGNNFLGTDLNGTPDLTTVLTADDMTGSVYVPAGTTEFNLTIAVHNIFNQTVSPSISFEGSGLALERSAFADGGSFNDGGEADLTNNESAVQTRNASPATPIITIID